MRNTEWLRAQIVVFIMTTIFVPLSALEATISIATTIHVLDGEELPLSTQFFAFIGPAGLLFLALISVAVVGILTIKGRHTATVVISMVIVIMIECFFFIAVIAAAIPLWRIIYRLME